MVKNEQVEIDGRVHYYETLTLPVTDSPDGKLRVIGIARELTALIESNKKLEELNLNLNSIVEERTSALPVANEKLKAMAYTDALTNLPNRHHFLKASKKSLSLSFRQKSQVSLLMIDLDFFKKINDSFGHLFGDGVLKSFAKMLHGHCREYDELCRYGGEEFLVLLPLTGSDDALEIATRILKQTQLL